MFFIWLGFPHCGGKIKGDFEQNNPQTVNGQNIEKCLLGGHFFWVIVREIISIDLTYARVHEIQQVGKKDANVIKRVKFHRYDSRCFGAVRC